MRLSRPCYDKPHRCPGWAGGGTHMSVHDLCDGGRIRVRVPLEGYPGEWEYPSTHPWRFGFCDMCDVRTWPWVTRRLDPGWWRWQVQHLRSRIGNWLYWKGWK